MLRWTRPSVRVLDGSRKLYGQLRLLASGSPAVAGAVHNKNRGRSGRYPQASAVASFNDTAPVDEVLLGHGDHPPPTNRLAEAIDWSRNERRIPKHSKAGIQTRHLPQEEASIAGDADGPSLDALHTPSIPSIPLPEPAVDRALTDTSADAHTPTKRNPSALQSLRAFLSYSTPRPPPSRIPTANTVKSLYTSVRSGTQFGRLSDIEFSKLISVFGTLSLISQDKPRPRCSFAHPLAFELPPHPPRAYWSFVFRVVRDKEHLGRRLSDSDRFWLMRAEIDNAVSCASPGQVLARAGAQYRHLQSQITDPELHVPYLRALLESGIERCRKEAIAHFCQLLEHQDTCNRRLIAILEQMIIRGDPLLSRQIRENILKALWTRVSRPLSPEELRPPLPSMPTQQRAVAEPSRSLLEPLVEAFQHVVFNLHSHRPSRLRRGLREWSMSLVKAVLDPANTALSTRWGSVALLAVVSASRSDIQGVIDRGIQDGPPTSPAAAEWFVIGALRTMEAATSAKNGPVTEEASKRMQGFIWTLWRLWEDATNRDQVRSRYIERLVMSTFFKVSAGLNAGDLVDTACERCAHHDLWSPCGEDTAGEADELAVQTLMAATLTRRNLAEIRTHMGPSCSSDVIDQAASRLLVWDFEAAYRLCRDPADARIASDGDSMFTRLAGLRYGGQSRSATGDTDKALTHHAVEEVLGAVPLFIAQYKTQHHSTLARLGNGVEVQASLSASVPASVRFQMEQTLLALARGHHATQVMEVARHIFEQDSHFFRPQFFDRLLRHALDRRQFRAAECLFQKLSQLHSSSIAPLRRLVVMRLARGGAASLARRAHRASSGDTARTDHLLSLANATRFNLRQPAKAHSLKTVQLLNHGKCASPSAYQHTMLVLVNSGRTLAAKQLFIRSRGQISDRSRSALGNMLLHVMIQRRNRGRGALMRRVLDTIAAFQAQHGFVPDRVTVNIFVKALTRWATAIDAAKLRALFDSFVRHGYPAGSHFAPGGVTPFGTAPPPGETMPLLRDVTGPPRFKKHVRPMYKMFVKAFYLRGDVDAARTVIGILKELVREDDDEAGRRERRRMKATWDVETKARREKDKGQGREE